jgi:hypothetical protein
VRGILDPVDIKIIRNQHFQNIYTVPFNLQMEKKSSDLGSKKP